MGRVEGDRLGGQPDLFLPLHCAMVCHGEVQAGGGAGGVLVVKSGRNVVAVFVRSFLRIGFGFYFRLRV